MTDSSTDIPQPPTPPDQIAWYSSRIIWMQIVGAVAALLGVAGHALSPDEQQNLVSGLTALATLVVTVMTIYHRVAKPCPPVAKKKDNGT